MQYLRCECGKREAWSSMGGNPACSGCPECGTTLAMDKSLHLPLEPHKWVQRFKSSDGTRDKDLCVKCMAVQSPEGDTPTADERYQSDGVRIN
jgi:hypothetical protein